MARSVVIPVARGFSGKRGASLAPESKARRRVIARFYWEEPQRSYRVREACIASENPRVTGINMYTLMKSEKTKLGDAAAGFRVYEQREVARYADLDTAVTACAKANRELEARHYLMNDSGQALYADTWID